jgi:hypothetical protein
LGEISAAKGDPFEAAPAVRVLLALSGNPSRVGFPLRWRRAPDETREDRLRLIQRRAPDLSEPRLLEALRSASALGEDVKGNHRMSTRIDGMLLVVVVDEASHVVVTIWREE